MDCMEGVNRCLYIRYDAAAKLAQPGRSVLRGVSRLWTARPWVTAERSLSLISLQPHQPPPIAFIRPPFGPRSRHLREPLLLAQLCAAFHTSGRLEILRLRLGCRAAPRRQPQYLELGHHPLQREAQPIADSHPMCRLDTLGVQMHFPAVDRGGRQAPRFVKTGVPKPLVQSMIISLLVACHKTPSLHVAATLVERALCVRFSHTRFQSIRSRRPNAIIAP
jgi:hypothetical protein